MRHNLLLFKLVGFVATICTLLFVLGSCQKELATDPVAVNRTITGVVRDSLTGNAIAGATVSISPCGGQAIATVQTGTQGNFAFSNVPVLPDPQCFNVVVSAPGHEPKSTTVQCSCTNLTVPLVLLKAFPCVLIFQDSPTRFSNTALGRTDTQTVLIRNPTQQTITITRFALRNISGGTIRLDTNGTAHILPSGTTTTMRMIFTSNQSGSFVDSVNVFVDCGSAGLLLRVEATVAACRLDVFPNPITFLTVGIGETTVPQRVILTNNTAGPITVTAIDLTSMVANRKFSIGLARTLPFVIQAGDTASCTIRFTSQQPGSFADTLRVTLGCNPTPIVIRITADAEAPTCSVDPSSLTFPILISGTRDTSYITIRNLSRFATLRIDAVSISPPLPQFRIVGVVLPAILQPQTSIRVGVQFEPTGIESLQVWIRIVSNGSCPDSLRVIGNSRSRYPVQVAAVDRWLAPDDPDYEYKGWHFNDKRVKSDTTRFCSVNINSNYPPPQNLGIDSADFRFVDFVGDPTTGYCIIHASNRLWKLGNVSPPRPAQPIPFTEDNWRFNVRDFNSFATLGCNQTFSRGDVIAIRKRDNTYALVQIEIWYTTLNTGYHELSFKYIPTVTPLP